MRRLRVFLDANVLVDARVRDVFLTLAEAHTLDVRWSQDVLDETHRALVDKLGIQPDRVDRLVETMTSAFPLAMIEGYEHVIDHIVLPDIDDRHVVAAAAVGECDWIATNNLRDFTSDVLASNELWALTSDAALQVIARESPAAIAPAVDRIIERLKKPSLTREQWVDRFAERCPYAAIEFGTILQLGPYLKLAEESTLASATWRPQETVRRLIEAIVEQKAADVVALMDPQLARDLTGVDSPSPDQLLQQVTRLYGDVTVDAGWGFATARRERGPGVEVVKLVHNPGGAAIAWEPTVVVAHVFTLELVDDEWMIARLGED